MSTVKKAKLPKPIALRKVYIGPIFESIAAADEARNALTEAIATIRKANQAPQDAYKIPRYPKFSIATKGIESKELYCDIIAMIAMMTFSMTIRR